MSAGLPGGLAFLAALEELPPRLRRALAELPGSAAAPAGVDPSIICMLTDGTWDDAYSCARQLLPGASEEEAVQDACSLELLRGLAQPPSAALKRRWASAPPEEVLAEALAEAKKSRYAQSEAKVGAVVLDAARAATPAVRPSVWRTKDDRRLALAGTPAACATVEEEARQRCLARLVTLLQEAGAPAVKQASGTADPERTLRAVAGSRRPRTLAKWLNLWDRYRRWLMLASGRPFPVTVADLVDYAALRADEPCGRSALLSVRGLFGFMEQMAGVPHDAELHSKPVVVGMFKSLLAEQPQVRACAVRKAPRLPLRLLAYLEEQVMDSEVPVYWRALAWWKLAASWGVLRFDDHRGWSPADARLTESGLRILLKRTKTTGAGKRVPTRPVFISKEAYLRDPAWLATGIELWNTIEGQRDYLLLVPDREFGGFSPQELLYAEAVTLTRGLFAGLRDWGVDVFEGMRATHYFTEHSPRAFLPSAAACLGFSPDWVDALGCWSSRGGEVYVRTVLKRQEIMQQRVAKVARNSETGGDHFDEEELLHEFENYLMQDGADSEAARKQVQLLRWGRPDVSVEAAPGPGDPLTMGDLPVEELLREECDYPEEAALDEDADDEADAGIVAAATPPREPPLHEQDEDDRSGPGADDLCEEVPEAVVATAPQNPGGVVAVEVLGGGRLPETEQGYVISISRSGWRRLHLLHACPRVPGFDYGVYEFLGMAAPEEDCYDDFCRHCWRGPGRVPPRPAMSEGEVEECDSPTTTTENEEPTER